MRVCVLISNHVKGFTIESLLFTYRRLNIDYTYRKQRNAETSYYPNTYIQI